MATWKTTRGTFGHLSCRVKTDSGLGASLDAKLIAFRVVNDGEVLVRLPPDPLLGRPESGYPLDLRVDPLHPIAYRHLAPSRDVEIEMDSILGGLRGVHLLEVDPRSDLLRVDDRTRGVPFFLRHTPRLQERGPRRVPGRRILLLVVKRRRPELR